MTPGIPHHIGAALLPALVVVTVAALAMSSAVPSGVGTAAKGVGSVGVPFLSSIDRSPDVAAPPCPTTGCHSPAVLSGPTDPGVPQWTNLTNPTAVSPGWTYNSAMTFDNSTQSVLLFGVLTGQGTWQNQTWEFSHGEWMNATPRTGLSPPVQGDSAMTYDVADGYALLFGCDSAIAIDGVNPNAECNDTWAFSAGVWREVVGPNPLAKDVQGPGFIRNQVSLTYDSAASYVVMTNGYDTWSYAGGVWTPLCVVAGCSTGYIPGPNLEGVATYDARDGYVLFDGTVEHIGAIPLSGSWTWKFANGAWTNISGASVAPPARIDSTMTYDASTGTVLLFGGQGPRGFLNDTWTFQGGSWTNATSGAAPSERTDSQMADDPPDSSVILFSGYAVWPDNATWAWSASPPIAELTISVTPGVPVPGQPATFIGSFRGGVGPFNYSWRFGDGGSSQATEPSHTFAANGIYLVNLWVNGSDGYVAHTAAPFRAYLPLAISGLRASTTSPVLGQTVTLTVTASAGTPPYTYSWSFGDGTTGGNLSSISHAYSTTGRFVAEVTVTDAVGGMILATITLQVGTSSGFGFFGSPEFAVLLGVSVGAIVIAAVGGVIVLRRRASKRENPSGEGTPPAAPRSPRS